MKKQLRSGVDFPDMQYSLINPMLTTAQPFTQLDAGAPLQANGKPTVGSHITRSNDPSVHDQPNYDLAMSI
jgi:hypothetical protein